MKGPSCFRASLMTLRGCGQIHRSYWRTWSGLQTHWRHQSGWRLTQISTARCESGTPGCGATSCLDVNLRVRQHTSTFRGVRLPLKTVVLGITTCWYHVQSKNSTLCWFQMCLGWHWHALPKHLDTVYIFCKSRDTLNAHTPIHIYCAIWVFRFSLYA